MRIKIWIVSVVKFHLFLIVFSVFFLAVSAKPPVIIINKGYRLMLNAEKGNIESFQAINGDAATDLLISGHLQLPLLKIEFLTSDSKFQSVTSSESRKITVNKTHNENAETIEINFEGIGNLDIDAQVTIKCPIDKPLTYWSLEIDNRTSMWIGHVQFPVVEIPFDHDASEENGSHILSSLYDGVLLGPVKPLMIAGAWRSSRRNTPETWRSTNYPRECTVQMMAYYNSNGGMYIACEDPEGLPKLIAPLVEQDGVTMGIGHYPGTSKPGKTRLPYQVVLGTFHGDWYSAANIYRDWAEKQPFCSRKLAQRTNFPKWILEPVVGIAFPMRGQGDWDPPASLNQEYTPATNALPYLDKLAIALGAPLMPILFNWEKAGPWVQPEAFPPIGGGAEMKSFMAKAKAKGWHPVLYGNGINWVVAQKNTGYDGMPYFKSHGGEDAIVRRWDGNNRPSVGWRSLYNTCVATESARKMILGMTEGMAQLNPDVIQQFDQGVGAAPCYAINHGHPPVPGPWMTSNFASLLKKDNEIARSLNSRTAISSEGAPPEIYLQSFDFWDARTGGGGQMMCPLYAFIYHEFLNGHAGFYTNSVNDEALRASVARALVSGYFLNFTLRDNGKISFDWNKSWDRAIPDQTAILDWAMRATQLRNGIARDYLIFGRMLKPWSVTNVTKHDFGYGKEPLVQSGTWKAPDGRIAVVLANYSDSNEYPRIILEGEGKKKLVIYNDGKIQNIEMDLPGVIDIKMLPRTLGLIEVK